MLITGYLGAGKTTLLTAFLRDARANRIAVVFDRCGDVGLAYGLIVGKAEETVLLSSGCMCRSVRGDLVQTLIENAVRASWPLTAACLKRPALPTLRLSCTGRW